jgi:hypothetical protein
MTIALYSSKKLKLQIKNMYRLQKIVAKYLIVVVIFVLADCKKSDNGPSIAGNWAVVQDINYQCKDFFKDYSNSCTSACPVYSFTSNTYSVSLSGASFEIGTYSISSSTITLVSTSAGTRSGPFTLSGSKLSFSFKNLLSGCEDDIYLTKK